MDWLKTINKPPLRIQEHDYICFKLRDLNTGLYDCDCPDHPCFAPHLKSLTTHAWEVRPSIKPGVIDALKFSDYLKWIELCKKNKIMPENAEGRQDNGLLTITMHSKNTHQMYAGLCCYRWATNLKDFPKLVLDLLEARSNLNFFQAFHYGLKLYNRWSGHSFTEWVTTYDNRINLIDSLVMCWFFKGIGNKNSFCEIRGSQMHTSHQIRSYGNSIGFDIFFSLGATGYFSDHWFSLSKKDYLLLDDWTELYDNMDGLIDKSGKAKGKELKELVCNIKGKRGIA